MFQVCDQPLIFLLDTPGVLSPQIESVETGLKLALCGEWLCRQTLGDLGGETITGLC